MNQIKRVNRHIHEMPFGPRLLGEKGAEFRLYAPEIPSVTLHLNPHRQAGDRESSLVMQKDGDGWHRAVDEQCRPGTDYCFELPGGLRVPDPASRYQSEDVHGPSRLLDPGRFPWTDSHFRGRPWEETVIYELHTGTFSHDGSFQGVMEHLDHLESLGITAIELMPLADFPGRFNWGYDGVLPYAPDSSYGTPDELKDLINQAHMRDIMVFLDVVYNHFGPEGNYLHVYANSFFSKTHQTPWGSGINYDGEGSEIVRQFVVHNVLYWLEEFRFDGLRFDAVDTIADDSKTHILEEIALAVRNGPGKDRHIHLILENVSNNSDLLRNNGKQSGYTAQWSDDIHHSCHVLLTGECTGYYRDFGQEISGRSALEHLGRSLCDGFSFQGEHSTYWGDKPRGKKSADLPPTSFISFLQNHDQTGNRALGDRIATLTDEDSLRAAVAIMLLAPSVPMLFMGEEWGSRTPFCWFADFGQDLAESVRQGRLNEFARFEDFEDPERRKLIPDPVSEKTFLASRLDWDDLLDPHHRQWLEYYRQLVALRQSAIVPVLKDIDSELASFEILEEGPLFVRWPLRGGGELSLFANMTDQGNPSPIFSESQFDEESILFQSRPGIAGEIALGTVPPWAVIWLLNNQ